MGSVDLILTAEPKRQKRIPAQKVGGSDYFYTPPVALDCLLPRLCPAWRIWEPSAGRGNIVRVLSDAGFLTTASDVETQQDFLTCDPPPFDCIVTNPPYSIKDDYLSRCYHLGKPFALLLPLTALEGQRRQNLYRRHGLEMILMDRRVNFETPSGKESSCWFPVAWFTFGFSIGQQLTFWKPESVQAGLDFSEEGETI